MGMAQEIERKFWIHSLPEVAKTANRATIQQGYLAVEPTGNEVRLREISGKFYLTVKNAGGLVREELETEITEAQFQILWPATAGRQIDKVRYSFQLGENWVELDEYFGSLKGLIVAEVEFPDLLSSNEFIPAKWMGIELTEMSEFRNKALSNGVTYEKLKALLE